MTSATSHMSDSSPCSASSANAFHSRHLGVLRRTVTRDDAKVMIRYCFAGNSEHVAVTFEAPLEDDLRLLNASEQMMDDLVYR